MQKLATLEVIQGLAPCPVRLLAVELAVYGTYYITFKKSHNFFSEQRRE